jgi:hypothetical protein
LPFEEDASVGYAYEILGALSGWWWLTMMNPVYAPHRDHHRHPRRRHYHNHSCYCHQEMTRPACLDEVVVDVDAAVCSRYSFLLGALDVSERVCAN